MLVFMLATEGNGHPKHQVAFAVAAAVLFCCLIPVQPVSAQNSSPAPPLRVTTRMVEVSVIVQDEHGAPISTLAKDDFQVFDQGKRQTISQFSIDSAENQPFGPIASAATNVFSNWPETETGVSTSSTAILIDTKNTQPADMAFARHRLEAFFREMLPTDRVAILSLSSELTLVRDFTNDANSLITALGDLQNSETLQMSGSNDLFSYEVRNYYKSRRAEETPQALISLARRMAGIPGRKSLIWISGSFPAATGYLDAGDRRSFEGEIGRAAQTLADANVAVYPVDARGLMAEGQPDMLPSAESQPDPRPFTTMDLIAQLTGGKTFYNRNDIDTAVLRAIGDSRVTYTLGYYPEEATWDGKFHEINVKVRLRGAQLRFRRGYFATQSVPTADPNMRSQEMFAAAADPLESTAIGLKLETISVGAGAPLHLKMLLTVNPRNILMNSNAGRSDAKVDVLYVEVGRNNDILASLARTVVLDLTPEARENTMKEGVKLVCDFPIRPKATVIRLVALDEGSGRLGTVTVPLSVLLPTPPEN